MLSPAEIEEPMTTTTNVTRVQDDYAQQIASDLSTNQSAQEQTRKELERLQQELEELQEGEKVLLKMQEALGISAKPASASAPSAKRNVKRAAVPAARSAGSRGAKKAPEPKAAATAAPRKRKAAGETEVKKDTSGGPSWLELVMATLAGQTEPRSAAEVTETISAAHPERKVQAAVIRNTLEQGVARGRLERSKQGRSVYYTPSGSAPADAGTDQPQPKPLPQP
ncbi:hypothetical protein ACF059_03960 [Streptomyces sp. NPDC016562]|uniref:hypothetical protein n=1 Tax=Streptomyces sp. NPDC016562 TaxID=3364966 RepID=UPI0036FE271E